MGKRGPATALTPEVQEKICKTLRAGNFLDTAISYAGLSRSAVRKWLTRGRREIVRVENSPRARVRQEEQIFVDFAEAVQQAIAHAETLHVATITKAASKHWQASAWMLERAHAKRWGAKKSVEVQGQLDMRTHIVVEIGGEDEPGQEEGLEDGLGDDLGDDLGDGLGDDLEGA